MDRKEFMLSLVAVGAAPSGETFRAQRRETDYTGWIAAKPEAVFPLLCPVREYDWIDGWQCRMVYSQSGVAEDNCIFETAFEGQRMVWTTTKYEPPTRIEYNVIAPDGLALRLVLTLAAERGGTSLRWRRIFTGLNEKGNAQIHSWQTERDAQLTEEIEHYLKTGQKRPRHHG